MANALYDQGKESFLDATINWDTALIRAILVDTGVYSLDLNLHRDYADLTGIIGTESDLFANTTVVDGVADADGITFPSVPGGTTIEAMVIFFDTGVAANDLLIAFIDSATGLPFTPNGGDVTVEWDNGANKIFAL